MSWPGGSDPWYQYNQADNNTRRAYYGINGIPAFRMDGTVSTLPSSGSYMTLINQRLDRESPYLISMDPSLQGANIVTPVTVTMDEDLPAGEMRLYVALVEEFYHLPSPGPNGISDYHYSMLRMYPNANGTVITGGAGEEFTVDVSIAYDSQFPLSNLAMVAWMQSSSTREVFQAQFNPVPATSPLLHYIAHQVDDTETADPNGRPDPGETAEITVTIENSLEFLATDNLVGVLTCDDENLTIIDSEGSWATIGEGEQGTNSDDPFSISVPEEYEERYVSFTLTVTDGSGYVASFDFYQLVGRPQVLLVNDHGAGHEDYDAWFNMFFTSGVVAEFNSSEAAAGYGIDSYPFVIWATSTATGDVLDESEIEMLTQYMDQGGRLILTGEQIGEDEGGNEWFSEYFKVSHRLNAPPASSQVRLVPHANSPFPDMDLILVNGLGHSTNPSTLTLMEGAVPFFKYIGTTEIGASGYENDTYSAIYLAFNLQAVSGMNQTTQPGDLLIGLLGWLDDAMSAPDAPHTTLPRNVELSTWPNPFNATMTVQFGLPVASEVRIGVFNLLGREVATLTEGVYTAGRHQVSWNAGNAASGIYLVRIETGQATQLRKVSLIK